MEGAKACSKCGEMKPLSEFNKETRAKDGRRSPCKECDRKRKREYRRTGRLAAAKRANPESYQLSNMVGKSKIRAKEKNLAHNIDVKYLRSLGLPSHCPYLGIKLRWKAQCGLGVKGGAFPDSPSIDRIDSSKGYVKGNVIIVSHRANAIKHNANEQELYKIAHNISQIKKNLACS